MWDTPFTINKILKVIFKYLLAMILVWALFEGMRITKNYEFNFTSLVIFLCFPICMSLAVRPSFKLKEIKWDIIIVLLMSVFTLLLDMYYRKVHFLEYPLMFLFIIEGYLIAHRFVKKTRSSFLVYEYIIYILNSFLIFILNRIIKRVGKDENDNRY
jgi:hypothetical protein